MRLRAGQFYVERRTFESPTLGVRHRFPTWICPQIRSCLASGTDGSLRGSRRHNEEGLAAKCHHPERRPRLPGRLRSSRPSAHRRLYLRRPHHHRWGDRGLDRAVGGRVVRAPTPTRRRAMANNSSVYRVTDLVGTSKVSWEDAVKNAVQTAGKSLRDLRVGEVSRLDVTIEKGKVTSYRARVNVSFKYER